MSDASEVKAAAERVMAVAGPRLESEYICVDLDRDAVAVAREYLRLTDETPADHKWLKSVGFQSRKSLCGSYEYRIRFREGNKWWCFINIHGPSPQMPTSDFCASLAGGGKWPGRLDTRGQVRVLCLSLGRELKESSK